MRFTRSLIVAVLVALVVVPAALALRFTDDSYNLPVGAVGESYAHWFRGDGGCGPALPYQFRILSGSLPPGALVAQGRTRQRTSRLGFGQLIVLGRAE